MDPNKHISNDAGNVILTPSGYWAFIPNLLPPKLTWSLSLVIALSEAERDLSRLAALADKFAYPGILIKPFIRNEAVISSRIEGTQSSLVDLYTYETAQLSFFERTDDVREVFNYVRAMDFGLERLKTLPVSLRLIRELHEILTVNVRGGTLTAGEFRRSQNWIGPVGSTPSTAPFVPPPVVEMHKSLDALEKFIHTENEIPALIRIGMIHYQFEAIHPFLDGNGRVGRLLIVLMLSEWNLLSQPLLNLSAYFDHYRQEYYDLLLGVSQNGAWETWLRFFLRGVSEQARSSVFRMERLQALRSQYQQTLAKGRNPIRMAEVLDFLFSRPILSIRQLADGTEMPFKTAVDYMAKLETARIVREITGYGRNRIFQADEILRAVQGMDG